MNSDNLKVIISDEIEEVMRERGIQENEIKEVISDALDEAVHLHTNDGTRFLAKKRLGNFTVYVEYTMEGDTYKVVNVYSHRVSLLEDQEKEE